MAHDDLTALPHTEEDDAQLTRAILDLGVAAPLNPEEAGRLLRRIFEVMQERGHVAEMPSDDWIAELAGRR